jgi:magnesium transporter
MVNSKGKIMSKQLKSKAKKTGMPPGSLIHTGDRMIESVKITQMVYNPDRLEEKIVPGIEEGDVGADNSVVTWFHVDGLHDITPLERIGSLFKIHPLALEDILHTDQRPKVDDYGTYVLVVLRALSLSDGMPEELTSEQISIIFGSHFIISFTEKESAYLDSIRERIRSGQGRIRQSGVDYLAYRILDGIVDQYFVILERLGEKIEMAEEKLIARPMLETLHAIQHLKREMLFLRKSVWPLREAISYLERQESPLISDMTIPYLRDIYDHTIQVIDTVETYRDMLSSMLDVYLSSNSNRLNEVMKVLTIIATIFMPLTFLAGVYGMNFQYMPELHWHWGYFGVWGLMIVIAIAMLLYFRKKKWL